MKAFIKYTLLLVMPLLMMGGLLSSCEDDAESTGTPVIRYVRVTEPTKSDSLLEAASLGNLVAIIGENLGDVRELWFNDQKANLNPAFVTNETILVTVPSQAPVELTNQMVLRFGDGSELVHDFEVAIPAPVIDALSNEYAEAGELEVITGNYFFEPMTVTFEGGATAEIVSVSQNSMEIIIPEGAQPGPITVASNFGVTESSLHYKDQRNIILNYDDLTAAGSWRPGPIASEDGIDGNYLRLFGTLNANERAEDNFESQFWGHTRFPEKTNLVEGNIDDLVLKFEARVVDWYGSVLQITWGPWDNAGNQEVWSNLNGRGIWMPWEETGKNFSTNGEWITVTIPINEMIYSHNQIGGENVWEPNMKFDKNVSGTLSFWVIATKDADNSPVEIHIDNVRIVEK